MPFTVLYAVLALLALLLIFGLTYKIKGVKNAFIATGIAFVIFVVGLVAAIYTIVDVMPN